MKPIFPAKLLVTTGFPYENGLKSEVIDLINPTTKCDTPISFPVTMINAFGGIFLDRDGPKNIPTLCGNDIEDSEYNCYCYFGENNVTKVKSTKC